MRYSYLCPSIVSTENPMVNTYYQSVTHGHDKTVQSAQKSGLI